MNAPSISIAMATYNGARFIAEQLESIAEQSLLPTELIITDDRSTDETIDIVNRFARTVPFTVCVKRNKAKLGFNRNFERALSHCRGEIAFICDQDDIWYPRKIERAVTELNRQSGKLALIHDEHILDPSGRTLDVTYYGNVHRLGYSDRELLSGNCTALKRPLLELLMPFPDGINYDYWIGWVADILDARIVLDEPLQLYRRHEMNSSFPVLAEENPTQLSILLRAGLPDPRPEWAANVHSLNLVAERIAEYRGTVDGLLGSGRADAATDRIAREVAGLEERVRLAGIPKWRRWPAVVRHWRHGFYSNFSGYKSAVKDLIRP